MFTGKKVGLPTVPYEIGKNVECIPSAKRVFFFPKKELVVADHNGNLVEEIPIVLDVTVALAEEPTWRICEYKQESFELCSKLNPVIFKLEVPKWVDDQKGISPQNITVTAKVSAGDLLVLISFFPKKKR